VGRDGTDEFVSCARNCWRERVRRPRQLLGEGDVGWRRCASSEFQMAGALRWNERSENLSLEVAGRDRVMNDDIARASGLRVGLLLTRKPRLRA
jgi:hypothetical protein